jgi:Ca2+-dependent lipid-binding protein
MKLEISVSASHLKNVAGFGKGVSDPFAVVTLLATKPNAQPIVLGKTEVLQNNLNPEWVHKFVLDYDLGQPSKIAVNIFDHVEKGNNKAMGNTTFDIGEILGSRGNIKSRRLKGGGRYVAGWFVVGGRIAWKSS